MKTFIPQYSIYFPNFHRKGSPLFYKVISTITASVFLFQYSSFKPQSIGTSSFAVRSPSHVRLFVTPCTATRGLPYPSPAPGVFSDSCPLNQ